MVEEAPVNESQTMTKRCMLMISQKHGRRGAC